MNRAELRVKIMIILYQVGLYKKGNIDYEIDDVIKEVVGHSPEFVKDTVYGIITHQNEIDNMSNTYLSNWTIDRLSFTDASILRFGVYELMYTETPPVVAINEAVELAKIYSDDKVKDMINGVLDKVYHEGE